MNNINPIATFCGLVLFANHNYVNTTILFVNTNTIVLTYDNILVQLIWLVSVLLSWYTETPTNLLHTAKGKLTKHNLSLLPPFPYIKIRNKFLHYTTHSVLDNTHNRAITWYIFPGPTEFFWHKWCSILTTTYNLYMETFTIKTHHYFEFYCNIPVIFKNLVIIHF